MAEIIDLAKRKTKQSKRKEGRLKRTAQAVAAALSCGICPRRCAHCGLALEEVFIAMREKAPYPMCDPCQQEYFSYMRYREGIKQDQPFWHTEEWAEMWEAWLHHMESIDKFRRTAQFLRLMEENPE